MSTALIITVASIAFSAILVIFILRQAGVLGPRKKVLATGTPGSALVVGVAPTGTVINEVNYVCRFQLRVQLPGATPYDVEAKDTVPITAMGAIVPGTVLAVRVDPTDPTKVFIDWNAAGRTGEWGTAGRTGEWGTAGRTGEWGTAVQPPGYGATAPAFAVATPPVPVTPPSTGELAAALHDRSVAASTTQGSAADLLRTGQPAQGYLRSFSDTGQTPRLLGRVVAPDAMDDPLFVMEVELRFGPGASPIIGTVIHRVPRAIAPTLYVGMPLSCAVDPGNPTRNFAIDFTAGQPAPGQPAPAPAARQW